MSKIKTKILGFGKDLFEQVLKIVSTSLLVILIGAMFGYGVLKSTYVFNSFESKFIVISVIDKKEIKK